MFFMCLYMCVLIIHNPFPLQTLISINNNIFAFMNFWEKIMEIIFIYLFIFKANFSINSNIILPKMLIMLKLHLDFIFKKRQQINKYIYFL